MAQKPKKKPPVKKTASPKAATDIKESIVLAALALAAERDWAQVSLRDIARKGKISLSALRGACEDKTDILVLIGRSIDRKVLEGLGTMSGPPRDQLFDVLMQRFDVLQEDREAVSSILRSFLSEPKQAIISLPHLCRSMNWMLEAAGMETAGAKGAAKIFGLSVIYLKVLKDWMEDDSEDLSKTMASLDQMLSRADQVADRLGL